MDQGNLLTIPVVPWKVESVGNSHSQLLLEFYDREQTPLRRYVTMLGIDPETARDIVQESFLKLHEHLLAGGEQSNLRAWLYRVVHNSARNRQASFGVKKTSRLEDMTPAASPVARELTAEEELLEKERSARLRQAMGRLSEAQRACVVLRTQGMKYREIAAALDLSVSTVGENIQRGLERLRELI